MKLPAAERARLHHFPNKNSGSRVLCWAALSLQFGERGRRLL